ncbi:Uma2 family endonuclease [Jiangella rhizosphaerae]|uniref:Uma2 family endonuclease n=1 Tax=Jiangella rhizosphaerae TaxID=2293569 RepID=A0A418KMN1_9ACTN|nr:Uma2 family endonuclease [Jiangella rhizosphaerae]RIQ20197.1 Uma2 family endonuclease [Jiangella rhizosphaerae]
MSAAPVPDWLRPPPGGFTADDLDRLPDLPPHTELIDGSLVFVSPQSTFHALVISCLEHRLRQQAPASLRVRREMTVTLGRQQRPEPDVLVIKAAAAGGMDLTTYRAEDVVLAVEVISPDSEARDRVRKPQLYAEAGIGYFWLVENVGGKPVVHVYELDPLTRAYLPAGSHHGHLRVEVPFDVDIDLTEIDRL